ncbi:Neurobeachin [Labeo rohita]|uniref:Neurobeachin n=1 Tax=Labeo rohita TaxID=84645 RepID=A0ABQ8M0E2_LABRO|nr:Neurobeachin [Labeo rohita]
MQNLDVFVTRAVCQLHQIQGALSKRLCTLSFPPSCRSVVVQAKKPLSGLTVNTVGSSGSSSALTSASTPNIFAAASSATPKSMINTTGATDASTSSSSSFVNGATSKNLPAVQTVAPMPEDTMENMRHLTDTPPSDYTGESSCVRVRLSLVLSGGLCTSHTHIYTQSLWLLCRARNRKSVAMAAVTDSTYWECEVNDETVWMQRL